LFSDTPSAPGLPEIVDWDETMVKLKWEPPIRDGGAPITGDFLLFDMCSKQQQFESLD
jgi:hypothetical protein